MRGCGQFLSSWPEVDGGAAREQEGHSVGGSRDTSFGTRCGGHNLWALVAVRCSFLCCHSFFDGFSKCFLQ